MELMNYSDVSDKDLVSWFGGVAYDHESMPKVVAVHTWTAEMETSTDKQGEAPNPSSLEQSSSKRCYSMKIGIRSIPQTSEDAGNLKRWTWFKENSGVKSSKFGNKVAHSSNFDLEILNQGDFQEDNAVTTSSDTSGILRPLLQKCSTCTKPPAGDREGCPSHNKTFWGEEMGNLSQMPNLLLMEHTNNKVNIPKHSETVTEALPVDNRLTSPGFNFSKTDKSEKGRLEVLDWSSVGVVKNKNDHMKSSPQRVRCGSNSSSQLCSGSSSKAVEVAGSECLQDQSIESSNGHMPQTSDAHLCNLPEQCPVSDKQMPQTPLIRPRKRSRKSTPRKVDVNRKNPCSGSHSTDSEATLSADDKPSESPDESAPVASSHSRFSPRSDEESSCGGTKVLFKRTAGVWSVSPLNSGVGENKEREETWNSNKDLTSRDATDTLRPLFGSDCDSQVKSTMSCHFTDRPIGSLRSCDPLMELCYSPALDREARIKELLSRQEKLLMEMRQKKSNSP